MPQPRLAVLIPAFNAQSTIHRALKSIPDQPWIQVIVCDDGSEQALQIDSVFQHAHFSLHRLTENAGCNAAMNYAASQILPSVEFLIELDADDEFADPHILAKMIQTFDLDPTLDLLWGNMQVVGEQNHIRKYPAYFDPWITVIKNPLPATTMMRRSSWQRAGSSWGTRPQHQDWYMWLCFAKMGAKGKNIKQIVYKYQVSQNGLLLSNKSSAAYRQAKTLESFSDLDLQILKKKSPAPRVLKYALELTQRSLPLNTYRKKRLQTMLLAIFYIKDFKTFKARLKEFIKG